MNERLREELKIRINLIVIALTSFISIGVIPFLAQAFNDASDEEIISTQFPESKIGWIVWALFRFIIVIINMSIFIAFVNQGKMNASNNENYKAALKRWIEVEVWKGKRLKKHKKALHMTPKQYYAKMYATKGVTLAMSSFASLFTVTFMVLNWDLVTFIGIVITVLIAIVFGFLQMFQVENYWENEFSIVVDTEYDKMLLEQKEEKKDV